MTGPWYLATPYSKWGAGLDDAFDMACHVAGELLKNGVRAYSPIVYGHPIAIKTGIDPLDHAFWLDFDATMIGVARGLIVYRAKGWEVSRGIAAEIKAFERAGKPVLYLDSGAISATFLNALDSAERERA